MWVHISYVAVVTQYLITLYLYTSFPLLLCSLKFFNTWTRFYNIDCLWVHCCFQVLCGHLLLLRTEGKPGVPTSVCGLAVMPHIRRAQRESLKMRRLTIRAKIHWQTSHNHLVNNRPKSKTPPYQNVVAFIFSFSRIRGANLCGKNGPKFSL